MIDRSLTHPIQPPQRVFDLYRFIDPTRNPTIAQGSGTKRAIIDPLVACIIHSPARFGVTFPGLIGQPEAVTTPLLLQLRVEPRLTPLASVTIEPTQPRGAL